jgi:hypothetical protein
MLSGFAAPQRNSTTAFFTVCQMPRRSGKLTGNQAGTTTAELVAAAGFQASAGA